MAIGGCVADFILACVFSRATRPVQSCFVFHFIVTLNLSLSLLLYFYYLLSKAIRGQKKRKITAQAAEGGNNGSIILLLFVILFVFAYGPSGPLCLTLRANEQLGDTVGVYEVSVTMCLSLVFLSCILLLLFYTLDFYPLFIVITSAWLRCPDASDETSAPCTSSPTTKTSTNNHRD